MEIGGWCEEVPLDPRDPESFNKDLDGLFVGVNYLNETEPLEYGTELDDDDGDKGEPQQHPERRSVVCFLLNDLF